MSQKLLKNKSLQIVTVSLVISLAIHFGLFFAISLFPADKLMELSLKPSKQKPIEIEFKSLSENKPKKKKDRIFVSENTVGKRVLKLDKLTKYYSKFSKKVLEESVKYSLNQFQQKKVQIKEKSKKKKTEKMQIHSKTEEEDIFIEKKQVLFQSSDSGIRNILPGVKKGQITALNTNQARFYTFYKRLNDKIYYQWMPLLNEYFRLIDKDQKDKIAFRDRTTELEIVLNKKGEVVDILLHRQSGISQLDSIAKETFINSSPFINPPKEMIETTGFVHINYSLTLISDKNTVVWDFENKN